MADDSPQQKYKRARERLDEKVVSGEITPEERGAIKEFLDAKDDQQVNTHPGYDTNGEPLGTFKPSTVWSYCTRLILLARRADKPLTEMDAADVNSFTQSLYDGTHADVKDGGLSQNTVCNQQGTLRTFYEWADFGPDKDSITMVDPEDPQVDPRDVYDTDDIQALRKACEHPRDRCLVDMLLYTGQRITALRTLRVKDVKPNEANGIFYLNTTAEGLKDAEQNGNKRPLLGATKAVRDWLEYHPADDDPDAALFCRKRPGPGGDTEAVGHSAVWKMLRDVFDHAGVDKPCNPHNFRHTFVTLAKREYDMDDATVKHLIGHSADSAVMETTYQHLTAEDHIQDAEESFGVREPESKSSLTPPTCFTCDEPLPDRAKACPSCGAVFTPDAKSAEAQIEQDMKDSYRKVDPDDMDTQEKVDALDDLLEDPDVKAVLLEKMGET